MDSSFIPVSFILHRNSERPNKRTVVVKNLEQQEMQMLYRLRQDLIYQRTALTNRIRGFFV